MNCPNCNKPIDAPHMDTAIQSIGLTTVIIRISLHYVCIHCGYDMIRADYLAYKLP